MQTVTSRQARQKFAELMDTASHGETIRVTRRGREVCRISPPTEKTAPLPDLTEFRNSLKSRIKGKPLSQTVIEMRDEERF